MSEKGDLAESLFRDGYNCAQSVAGAFADELGLPLGAVVHMAGGFGGGFGRLREMCGAVSGATLVLSILRGYDDPKDDAAKAALYAEVQQLANDFRAANGSYLCRELLGEEQAGSGSVPAPRTAAYYESRPCAQLCRSAAELLEAQLARADEA